MRFLGEGVVCVEVAKRHYGAQPVFLALDPGVHGYHGDFFHTRAMGGAMRG